MDDGTGPELKRGRREELIVMMMKQLGCLNQETKGSEKERKNVASQ